MEITSRKEADLLGEKFYYTGVPCVNGHDSTRFVKSNQCRECNRIACEKKALRKRDKTPGAWDEYCRKKEKHSHDRYLRSLAKTRRRAEKMARDSALENGESQYKSGKICPLGHIGNRYSSSTCCVKCSHLFSASSHKKEYDIGYYEKHKERISKRSRNYYEQNREEQSVKIAEWQKANPELVRAIKQSYKHRRRAQEKSGLTTAELRAWAEEQIKVCYWCLTKCEDQYHIDHYAPLAKGGKHEIDNLVIACPTCNMRKNAKDPYEYANSVGRLF